MVPSYRSIYEGKCNVRDSRILGLRSSLHPELVISKKEQVPDLDNYRDNITVGEIWTKISISREFVSVCRDSIHFDTDDER